MNNLAIYDTSGADGRTGCVMGAGISNVSNTSDIPTESINIFDNMSILTNMNDIK